MVGILYRVFGRLPQWLSKQTGQTENEIERTFSLIFLFGEQLARR